MPRAGLGKPWSTSNANKPASSWPLKQGPKKWSDLDSTEQTLHSPSHKCLSKHTPASRTSHKICLQPVHHSQERWLILFAISLSPRGGRQGPWRYSEAGLGCQQRNCQANHTVTRLYIMVRGSSRGTVSRDNSISQPPLTLRK